MMDHTLPPLWFNACSLFFPIRIGFLRVNRSTSLTPQPQTQPQKKQRAHTTTPDTDVDNHIRELQNL